MDEFELIRRHFVRHSIAPDVVMGIGDDGAVLKPDPDCDLIAVVDTIVEGTHFLPDTDAADIGYRAVAINLSDIAAMGGSPRWMTLGLTLRDANDTWLEEFAKGLHAAAAEHGVVLVGGDTTRGNCLVVSVQMIGNVASGTALRRNGANVGDTIFVTGTVGDAAAGLELIRDGRPDSFLSSRLLRPTARVEYGQSLTGVANAAIDVSDGLFADVQKLLAASGVGGVLDLESLPMSAALRSAFDSESALRLALSGGDDYELCFTANAADLPDSGDLPVTAIGSVKADLGLVCRDARGIVEFSDSGYRHFE